MQSRQTGQTPQTIAGRILQDLTGATLQVIVVSVAIIITLIGPFGTFSSMDLGTRALFWPSLIVTSVVIASCIRSVRKELLPHVKRPLSCIVEGVSMSTLFTPIVLTAANLAYGRPEQMVLMTFELWLIVMVIYVLISGSVGVALDRIYGTDDVVAEPVRPRLMERIDGASDAPVVRLSVQDHYVEVYQADGSVHRLLMRFKDAVNEMETVDGFCVHRSHWVVASEIANTFRRKGRDFLTLKNGTEIPVSRTYRPNLVEAGFLEPRD